MKHQSNDQNQPAYAVRFVATAAYCYNVYEVATGRSVKIFGYVGGNEKSRAEAEHKANALRNDLNAKERGL